MLQILTVVLLMGMLAQKSSVPIMNTFKNKIVYTMDSSADVEPLKEDCKKRGGEFNLCGSTCDESEDETIACAAVCAFTCDLE
ncbi:MAG: hypothetical protein A2Z88_06690 [Omnitrophica WOR_2 bacterium GWA2_47_8]|nr:MAG: hypothetical protein A2Z88_06690 [Omnitrophica WOR_2 bacterium GWA2_47_8]